VSPDAQGDASGHRLRRGCLDVTALFPGVPAGAKQSRHAGATWPPCRGRSLARSSAPREVALEVGNVLLNVLVVLVAAKLGAEASERLGQPAVLGELVLGVLIGPSGLGLVGHDQVLAVLAELGVLLLLLQVGLETELTDLLRVGRAALAVAVTGVVLPFALGWGMLRGTGLAGQGQHVELFLAAALTATSVGITARVFGDLKLLARAEARTVLGAAVADDVIGLIILTVIARVVGGGELGPWPVLGATGAAVAFLVAGAGAGLWLAPGLFHWIERRARSEGTLIALALAFALGFARLAGLVGLAPIVGAFVAGVVLSRTRTRGAIGSSLAPIAHVFVPVFFLQIGIDADLGQLLHPDALALAGLLFAVAVVGKVLAGLATVGTGMDALLVGLGMLPRGEVGLIFASLGLRAGVLNGHSYGALLLVVLATTFVTPPLLRWRVGRAGAGAPAASSASSAGELIVVGDTIELTAEPRPGDGALLGLRAARLAAAAHPGARLLGYLPTLGPDPVRWSPALRDELLALLADGRSGSWALLEQAALLGVYLPEVAQVRERHRQYQGDRPWRQLAALARLTQPSRDPAAAAAWLALDRPAPLLLAGLVRAVTAGAGQETDPVSIARQTARRLGLGATDEQDLAALVATTGDLAEAAVHTDVRDEEQVQRRAASLGSPERARMAYLLALAEQQDGGEWESWRRGLLEELFGAILAAMAEPGLIDRAAENLLHRRRADVLRRLPQPIDHQVEAWLEAAPRRYLLAHSAEVIAAHLTMAASPPAHGDARVAITRETPELAIGAWRIDVVTWNRHGLLAALAGTLTDAGFDIRRAQAATWPNQLVVAVFHVVGTTTATDPALPERIAHLVRGAATGQIETGPRPEAQPHRRPPGQVLVRVDAAATPWHSVVRVQAPDYPGLLHEVLGELARQRVDVLLARIGAENGNAHDVFFVTDAAGDPIDRKAADHLGTALVNRLAPSGQQLDR
jgi:Kef-type K+ transport system membrane component KefB